MDSTIKREEVIAMAQAIMSGPAGALFIVTSPLGDKHGINIQGLYKTSVEILSGFDTLMNPPKPAAGILRG